MVEYSNDSFGYSINYPRGWRLDTQSGGVTAFVAEQSVAELEILSETITRGSSLGEYTDQYRQRLLQRAQSWKLYEHISATGEFRGATNFIHLEFRRQVDPGDCVENVITHLYRSRYFPDKLQGFAVSVSICEDSLRRYQQRRELILASFEEYQ